jgi:membrane protein insertase Oxa1/YidC/SpoIIIJ
MATDNNKNAIPTWGVITFIVTILIGTASTIWAVSSSTSANRIIKVETRVDTIESKVNQDQVDKESMKKDLEYIKRDVNEILDIMKHKR